MNYFLIALKFLTTLNFKLSKEIKEKDYGRSLLYFPFVGILIGGILSVISLIFNFLPQTVLVAIILLTSAIITGALHLDGFADTCDGFYGSKSKEEILRIMHDSRIGVMAAVGLFLLLLLKFSLIISLPKYILWRALIMICCFSRWVQTLGCLVSYAGNEGKAKFFIKYARKKDVVLSGIFTIFFSFILFGLKGIVIFLFSSLPALLFIHYAKFKIGGMTGDTIGAVNEISELSNLLFILIWT
ncbi:MAG: adenosylcobinamide-GDP ribazoletransferase [Candidatus Omnitrophica bacterium]|nr:adenosylcobinamide-GDP ribazoletransferase [Candidatus Omnitrophota bacterium]